MAEMEINLRFKTTYKGVVEGLLEWLEEVREKEGITAISIHVRYVEG